MYETVDNPARASLSLPLDAQLKFRDLADEIAARSLIVWGEHCSECAFPTCYTSCAFYTPRRDLHCRRFANGIEQGAIGNVALGRIQFRKWAKLEGAGPVELFSMRAATRRERLDRLVSSLIIKFAPSHATYSRSARYWNKFKTTRAVEPMPRIDSFVVEAWLPSGPPIPLTITFLPMDRGARGFFQSRFDLQVGYNRMVLPYLDIAARIDLNNQFLIQVEPVGDAVGREVIFGLIDFVRFTAEGERPAWAAEKIDKAPLVAGAASGERARTAKCVVWDLDDTLWRGTLAEDGHESLTLDPMALSTIIELDRRGVLQSIASKNDPAATLAALQAFKIRDYFLFPQIGWGPKSGSVERIAELLDIG
jgi:hypothetical protein